MKCTHLHILFWHSDLDFLIAELRSFKWRKVEFLVVGWGIGEQDAVIGKGGLPWHAQIALGISLTNDFLHLVAKAFCIFPPAVVEQKHISVILLKCLSFPFFPSPHISLCLAFFGYLCFQSSSHTVRKTMPSICKSPPEAWHEYLLFLFQVCVFLPRWTFQQWKQNKLCHMLVLRMVNFIPGIKSWAGKYAQYLEKLALVFFSFFF